MMLLTMAQKRARMQQKNIIFSLAKEKEVKPLLITQKVKGGPNSSRVLNVELPVCQSKRCSTDLVIVTARGCLYVSIMTSGEITHCFPIVTRSSSRSEEGYKAFGLIFCSPVQRLLCFH